MLSSTMNADTVDGNLQNPFGDYWVSPNKDEYFLEINVPDDYRENKVLEPDTFVNLNEDLYQMHKMDDYNLNYGEVPSFNKDEFTSFPS